MAFGHMSMSMSMYQYSSTQHGALDPCLYFWNWFLLERVGAGMRRGLDGLVGWS